MNIGLSILKVLKLAIIPPNAVTSKKKNIQPAAFCLWLNGLLEG